MRFQVKKYILGHVSFDGYFVRKKLKSEMAPNMSLDERLDICARALLNNFMKV